MTEEQWLAANGGPRKFEQGATGDLFNLKTWLLKRGYDLGTSARQYTMKKIGGKGPAKKMSPQKVWDFVDGLRIEEGLQPLRRRA